MSRKTNKDGSLGLATTSVLPALVPPADPHARTAPAMQAARRVRTDEYECLDIPAPLSLKQLQALAERDGLPTESLFKEREGHRPAGSRRAVMLRLPPAQPTITLGGEDPAPPPKNRKP